MSVAARAPNLYRALRGFALGAFRFLAVELESGAELSFAFDEHRGSAGRPALYEYRPLVRTHVEARDWRIYALEDTTVARFGAAHLQKWDATYAFFVGLFAAGRLGGGRLVARRAP